ncbi:MAG: periplasmic heavy metal sensor [Deltaproteobacteria bacterium]|nr:periplasmic heavy metal sensor [Deltaproteobacteria bacterium]
MFGIWMGIGLGALATLAFIKHHHHRVHGRHHGCASTRRRSEHISRWLGRRLDATPGQTEAIREAVEEIGEALSGLRGGVGGEAATLAGLFRNDTFDRAPFDELAKAHRERIQKLEETIAEALERVYAVLEPSQREELAALIERHFGWRHAHC